MHESLKNFININVMNSWKQLLYIASLEKEDFDFAWPCVETC